MPSEQFFERNQQWLAPGDHSYNTDLGSREPSFRQWVIQNKVPFDVSSGVSDYDMRGFWNALQTGDPRASTAVNPNDSQIHFPDYWKTPYHESFSAESQWADPAKAPKWNDKDQLVLPDGTVVFDEKSDQFKQRVKKNQTNKENLKKVQSDKK